MKKKIMCLLMAIFMLMNVSLTVHAEHFQGSDGWKVEFLGNEIVSNFQSNQIQEEIYNIGLLAKSKQTNIIQTEMPTTQEDGYWYLDYE